MRIAFFDLDKTLISRNSATLWIKFEFSAGRLNLRQALKGLVWVLRYSMGKTDMGPAIRQGVESLTGEREEVLRERALVFYESLVKPCYRPGAREAIEKHREAGDRLVLLTSASNYVSELVCRELSLDGYVSNKFELDDDGRHTGRPIEPLCFGEGKVELAKRYVKELGLTLQGSTFYSDSHSDLPMLEATGLPLVVNPDPKLRRHARRRGWKIFDWGVP